jgi:hypothetical protein
MAERVAQPGAAGTEDLVDDVPVDGRASVARLPDSGVDVIDVKHQTDRRTSSLLRSELSLIHELVGDVDTTASESDLGVTDLAIGHGQPMIFDRAQALGVEDERSSTIRDDQVGNDVLDDMRMI